MKSSITENGMGLGTAYAVMRDYNRRTRVILTTTVCIHNRFIYDRKVQLCSSHAGGRGAEHINPVFPLQDYARTLHTLHYYATTCGSFLSYYRACIKVNEETLLHIIVTDALKSICGQDY